MSTRRTTTRLTLLASVIAVAGCEVASTDFDDSTPGTGGTATAGTGGSQAGTSSSSTGGTGTGGSTAGTGGSTGGSVTTGGGSGGPATGGSAGTGTGGSTAGTGATGGATAGTGTGGSAAGAGGSTGGAAGSGTAGTGAMGGAMPTSGCNAATFPASGEFSLMVEGTDVPREYIVAIPEGYVSSTPHRLVFAFHGLTGTMEQIANGFGGRNNGYYGLQSGMTDTIFVAPQGLAPADAPADFGWPNDGGQDVAFVEAMVAWLSSNYCIDATRVFSTGMSYGGIMSNTLGCQMPDTFRAIGSIAGAMFGRNGCDGKQVAAWMTHGTADETIDIAQGEAARDAFVAKNHCTATTMATTPEGCLAYQGCDAGYPVVWCTHSGGHTIPSYSGAAITAFFNQF